MYICNCNDHYYHLDNAFYLPKVLHRLSLFLPQNLGVQQVYLQLLTEKLNFKADKATH